MASWYWGVSAEYTKRWFAEICDSDFYPCPNGLSSPTHVRGHAMTLVLCLVSLLGAPVSAQVSVTLEVLVSGVEGAEGTIGIALWRSERGFPEDIDHAISSTYVPIADGRGRTVFNRLEAGTYAVTVFHDENDNQRFDKNFIGIPREAWGVSNDVRPRMRAPRFEEARFELRSGDHTVEIRVE